MNESKTEIQAQPWSKLSRRWLIALCITLCINGVTVVGALGDRALGQHLRATHRGDEELAVAHDESAQADNVSVPVTEETQASFVVPATLSSGNETPNDPPAAVVEAATISGIQAAGGSISKSPTAETETTGIGATNYSGGGKGDSEPSPDERIVIINPPGTGGVVHYMIDGTSMSLMPGEYAQLESNGARRVDFHRGGDLSDTQLRMESGAYIFSVSQAGWELLPTSTAECERLMVVCRSIQ